MKLRNSVAGTVSSHDAVAHIAGDIKRTKGMANREYGSSASCTLCGREGCTSDNCPFANGVFTAKDVTDALQREGGRVARTRALGLAPVGFLSRSQVPHAAALAPEKPPAPTKESRKEKAEQARKDKAERLLVEKEEKQKLEQARKADEVRIRKEAAEKEKLEMRMEEERKEREAAKAREDREEQTSAPPPHACVRMSLSTPSPPLAFPSVAPLSTPSLPTLCTCSSRVSSPLLSHMQES